MSSRTVMGKDVLKKKLKILCLHGYRQNGETFRQKTGAFRKLLKKYAEFECITAPLKVPSLPPTEGGDGENGSATEDNDNKDQHGWWFTSEEQTYNSKEYSPICIGFDRSLAAVELALDENGPFDGVLGFSQGASFVSMLCSMQQKGVLKGQFRFAVMVSGFKSRCTAHNEYYSENLSIPSLHIIGETDSVIPKDMSQDLVSVFSKATVIVHSGGHYVPASGDTKQQLCQFFEEQMNEPL